jgi:hypothetical protein
MSAVGADWERIFFGAFENESIIIHHQSMPESGKMCLSSLHLKAKAGRRKERLTIHNPRHTDRKAGERLKANGFSSPITPCFG